MTETKLLKSVAKKPKPSFLNKKSHALREQTKKIEKFMYFIANIYIYIDFINN